MSGEGSSFRKASDTRQVPAVPTVSKKAMRSEWMNMATTTSSSIGGTPLTASQASQLLDASNFPASLNKYKKILIQAIVNKSVNTPPAERRPFDTLLKLASHPCSREPLEIDAFPNYQKRVEEAFKMEDPMIPPEEHALNLAATIAVHLVDGFDVLSKKHFIFDSNGNVVNVTKKEMPRYGRMCIPYLLRKEQEGQFRQFLKDQSDPYKGSQQGLGKTRRHKKRKSKKTNKRKLKSTRI